MLNLLMFNMQLSNYVCRFVLGKWCAVDLSELFPAARNEVDESGESQR